jgi:hypothetical protein
MRIPELDKLFNVKRRKKASLSLSINAIVVLVLAISMLGLGLAFTKSMFKKFGEKLTVPPPDIPATTDEPVVLPSDEIEVRHGDEFTFQVNYYNDHATGRVDAGIECFGVLKNVIGSPTLSSVAGANAVISAPQKVEGGIQKPFKFVIPKSATDTTHTGNTDVCEVKFCAPDVDNGVTSIEGCDTSGDHEDGKQITIRIT